MFGRTTSCTCRKSRFRLPCIDDGWLHVFISSKSDSKCWCGTETLQAWPQRLLELKRPISDCPQTISHCIEMRYAVVVAHLHQLFKRSWRSDLRFPFGVFNSAHKAHDTRQRLQDTAAVATNCVADLPILCHSSYSYWMCLAVHFKY